MSKNRVNITICLTDAVVDVLNSLPRNSIPNKSKLINELLYNYLSCSFSGSLV